MSLSGFTGGFRVPMIAALMTSSPKTVGGFAELARKSAEVRAEITALSLPRLADCVNAVNQVSATLRFGQNEQQRVMVVGSVTADCDIDCHLCLESKRNVRTIDVSAFLARDEAEAVRWSQDDQATNIVVVDSDRLDTDQFVEDELLVTLTDRVCHDVACENRPAVTFPPVGDACEKVAEGNVTRGNAEQNESNEGAKDSPFAVLAQLKRER